jgi:hypothetical protein
LSLLRDENFFSLNKSIGVSKNPSFHTDDKNVRKTLVNSAPNQIFSQKSNEQLKKVLKNLEWGVAVSEPMSTGIWAPCAQLYTAVLMEPK